MQGSTGISPESLINLMQKKAKVGVVDVRDSDFGEYGVIKNAIHFPYYNLNDSTAEDLLNSTLKNNKYDKLVCYCKFGKARSVMASNKIAEIAANMKLDENKVTFLKGGICTFITTEGSQEFLENAKNINFK